MNISILKYTAVAATLLLGSIIARAQDQPMTLTVEQAVQYALAHNDSVKSARLGVSMQEAQNREITGSALPQISAKNDFLSYPRQVLSPVPAEFAGGAPGTYVFLPFQPRFNNTASISANQLLFDGSVIVALQARNTLIELASLGAKTTERDVRYNVRRAYFAMVVAQKQFDILKQSLAFFRRIAYEQGEMQKAGFVEKIEIDRLQVQLNNLQTDSLRTGNLMLLTDQLLKFNMGMDLNTPIVLVDTMVERNIETAQASLLTDAEYSNRLEYKRLQTAQRLNEFNLKRYRYQALPSLSAFGSLAATYANNDFSELLKFDQYINYATAGFSLNIPIFSGFSRTSRVQQAKITIERTKHQIAYLENAIDLQKSQSRITLRNALLTLQNEERNLELANSVLDLARKKYNAGVGSNLEVTTAQSDLLRAQNTYFSTLLEVVNANTDLQLSLGGFNE